MEFWEALTGESDWTVAHHVLRKRVEETHVGVMESAAFTSRTHALVTRYSGAEARVAIVT